MSRQPARAKRALVGRLHAVVRQRTVTQHRLVHVPVRYQRSCRLLCRFPWPGSSTRKAILVTQGVDDATDDRTHGFGRRIGLYIVPADWSSRGHTLREALEYPGPVGLFAAAEDVARGAEPHPARDDSVQCLRPIRPIVVVVDDRFADDADTRPDDRRNRTVKCRKNAPPIGSERELDTPVIGAIVDKSMFGISTSMCADGDPVAWQGARKDVELDRKPKFATGNALRLQCLGDC